MSQTWSDTPYNSTDVADTDLTAFMNNFLALKSMFSGLSAPSNPVSGQLWYNTTTGLVNLYRTNAWITVYDFTNDCVAPGKVKTASLADGCLSADSTGRAKMANLFITNAHVNDVDGSKIAANSIAVSKFADNCITPSKMTPGGGTLISWHSAPCLEATYVIMGVDSVNLTTSYVGILHFYVYIPAGAKYIIMSSFSGMKDHPAQIRLTIDGTGFCEHDGYCTSGYGMGPATSSAADISAYAGSWRTVKVQAKRDYAEDTIWFGSIVVQWYGA